MSWFWTRLEKFAQAMFSESSYKHHIMFNAQPTHYKFTEISNTCVHRCLELPTMWTEEKRRRDELEKRREEERRSGPLLGVQKANVFTVPKMRFLHCLFCQNSHGFNKLQCFGKSNCPSLPKHHVVWNCRMIQGYHPSVSYWRCQLTSRSLCPVVLFGFCLGCFGVVFVLFVCCSCFFLFVFSTVTANWTVYWSCVSSSFVAHLLWRWITSLL